MVQKFLEEMDVVPFGQEPLELFWDDSTSISQNKEPRSHHKNKVYWQEILCCLKHDRKGKIALKVGRYKQQHSWSFYWAIITGFESGSLWVYRTAGLWTMNRGLTYLFCFSFIHELCIWETLKISERLKRCVLKVIYVHN